MPLQGSGAISISQIRTELINVNASYSLRTLSSAAGKSAPDAMSEFYGYTYVPPNPPYGTFYTTYCEGYNIINVYHNGDGGYYYGMGEERSASCGCIDPNIYGGTQYAIVCACNWGTFNIDAGWRDYWAGSAQYFCTNYPGSGLYVKYSTPCNPNFSNLYLETGGFVPNFC